MKKFLAILLFLTILTSNSVIMTAAKETYIDSDTFDLVPTGENNLSVPRIDIRTENGNGASLLKSDGYDVSGGPRITGDGYYESCVVGFENILIEITV